MALIYHKFKSIIQKKLAGERLLDGYGVGTTIINAPVVDFSMGIVELNRKPMAQSGKCSGTKRVLRCLECQKDFLLHLKDELEFCECGERYEELLTHFIDRVEFIQQIPKPAEIGEYVLKQLEYIVNL